MKKVENLSRMLWLGWDWLFVLISGVAVLLFGFVFVETMADFSYWGYPQWAWFYKNKILYAVYFLPLLVLSCGAWGLGVFLWRRNDERRHLVLVAPVLYLVVLVILGMFFSVDYI